MVHADRRRAIISEALTMTLSRIVLTFSLAAFAAPAFGSQAQRGATPPPAAAPLAVAAVVGCIAAEGSNWFLTNASEPIVVLATDGKSMTGTNVSVDRAKQEPAGKQKYRLINNLTEFGVPEHKGQRVLVRGLVVGSGANRRINLVSFEPVAPACQ